MITVQPQIKRLHIPSTSSVRLHPNSAEIYLIKKKHNQTQVHQFIQSCFYQHYGAKVYSFAKGLLALTDKHQRLVAALGHQSAANSPLFLEQYLNKPIEAVLVDRGCSNGNIRRDQILELGNLAAISLGSTRRLILSLIGYFYQQGYRWVAITLTPKVLNSFQKLGIDLDLIELAKADPGRLKPNKDDWGRYYDDSPMVYAGCIERALNRLQQHPLIDSLIKQSQHPISDSHLFLENRETV